MIVYLCFNKARLKKGTGILATFTLMLIVYMFYEFAGMESANDKTETHIGQLKSKIITCLEDHNTCIPPYIPVSIFSTSSKNSFCAKCVDTIDFTEFGVENL